MTHRRDPIDECTELSDLGVLLHTNRDKIYIFHEGQMVHEVL